MPLYLRHLLGRIRDMLECYDFNGVIAACCQYPKARETQISLRR